MVTSSNNRSAQNLGEARSTSKAVLPPRSTQGPPERSWLPTASGIQCTIHTKQMGSLTKCRMGTGRHQNATEWVCVLCPPQRALYRRPQLLTKTVGGRKNLVSAPRGILSNLLTFCLFHFGTFGFHVLSLSTSFIAIYTLVHTEYPWCRSLLAVVIPHCSFLSLCSPPSHPSHLSLPEAFRIHCPTHICRLPACLLPTLLNTIWPCTYTWFYTFPSLIRTMRRLCRCSLAHLLWHLGLIISATNNFKAL